MSLEQINYAPREGSLSSPELVFRSVTTINTLLGRKMDEPLSLGDAPLIIATRQKSPDITEHLAILNIPLAGIEFLNFLRHASPDKEFSKYGILAVKADWEMPDRRDNESQDLLKKHQSLKEVWDRFEESRKYFLGVLLAPSIESKPTIIEPITVRTVEGMRLNLLRKVGEDIDPEWLMREFSEEMPVIREKMAHFLHRRRGGKETLDQAGMESVIKDFFVSKRKTRKRAFREFFGTFDKEQQEKWLTRFMESSFLRLDLGNHVGYVNKSRFVGIQDALQIKLIQYAPDSRLLISFPDKSIEVAPVLTDRKKIIFKTFPETLKVKNFLKPFIHWETRDRNGRRERKFLLGLSEEPSLEPFVKENSFLERSDQKPLDPLGGLILLAYFSQDIVDSWTAHESRDKRMPLPESKGKKERKTNPLGATAIPIFLQMKQGDLLHARVLEAMENYASATT